MTQNDISPTLLNKWLLAITASKHRKLSSADLAVLLQICERFNAGVGAAWPSLQTLARDTGRTKRAVQNCVKRLEAYGFIGVIPGSRIRSNRYVPNFGVGKVSATQVGQPSTKGRESERKNVEHLAATKSSDYPGQKAGVIRENIGEDENASAQALPSASRPPAGPGFDDERSIRGRYPTFYEAFGWSDSWDADQVDNQLDFLVDYGTDLTLVIAGATACRAQRERGKKPFLGDDPIRWLKDGCWLDYRDYLPPKELEGVDQGADAQNVPSIEKISTAVPLCAAGAQRAESNSGIFVRRLYKEFAAAVAALLLATNRS